MRPHIFDKAACMRLLVVEHKGNHLPLFDARVDRYWTAEAGPAVVALARFVAVEGEHRRTWAAPDLARAVGFASSLRRLGDVATRAEVYGFLKVTSPEPGSFIIAAWSTVPALPARAVERLPELLRLELAGAVAR